MQIKKITNDIWQIKAGLKPSAKVYLITEPEPILIDLGNRVNSDLLIKALGLIGFKPKEIKKVIFTHFHYDHIGQPSLFKKAEFFASEDEIISFRFSPKKTTIHNWEELEKIKLKKIPDEINGLEVIKTTGNTRGSICLYYEKERVLFSGDTFFKSGIIGRTDLPTSTPSKMKDSLLKLANYDYKILCPSH